VLAQEAAAQLGLDEVLLVPVGEPPHKELESDPGAGVRLEMTRLAAEGNDRFRASDAETGREGPSFSYRTLELLREERKDDDLVFLMGADVAAGLGAWREPERVVEVARVGVAARPGSSLEEARAAVERLGARERASFFEMPAIGVSSTTIRRRVARGLPVRYLVPDAVEGYILERGLYGA
jgi:nicotinate-nucleotide adenylyltransferase